MDDSRRSPASRRSIIAGIVSIGSMLVTGCMGIFTGESTDTPAPTDTDTTATPTPTPPVETETPTPEPVSPPEVELSFTYFENTHLLDIAHGSGDSITAENTGTLEVTGDVSAGPLVVDDESAAPYESGDEFFGDITVLSGDVAEVQWTANNGSTTKTLGVFETP